jgi:hypothetical protein
MIKNVVFGNNLITYLQNQQLPNTEKFMHFIKCVSLFTCYVNYDSQRHISTLETVRARILPQDYSKRRKDEKIMIFILKNTAPSQYGYS